MYTRKMLLDKECTHEQYYGQFVNDGIKAFVTIQFGEDRLAEAYKADESLNTIPLAKWDMAAKYLEAEVGLGQRMRETGNYPTLAGYVCILKEAARQVVNDK